MTAKLRLPDPRVLLLAAAIALALPASADAITFPDGDIQREGVGDSGATVSWRAPAASGGSLQGAATCDPASGSAFPTGTTKVDCFAAVKVCDQGPPLGLCVIQLQRGSFDVTVTRGAGPELTGLADRAATAVPGSDSAVVEYPLPQASDPSGVAAGSVGCAPAPGSSFPVGDTTVTCGARDAVGNSSSATFRVSVSPAPAAPAEPVVEAPAVPGSPAAPGTPAVEVPRTIRPVALGARLRIVRGRARVSVSCPAANPDPCRGTLKLETTGKRAVGRAKFSVAPGRKAGVRVRLSRSARRTLARQRKAGLRAVATTSDQAGRPLTTTRSFKVRLPR